jgi:predicted 2-oxoglutarate/Fe(II)-dependent dioxygenase YbiX
MKKLSDFVRCYENVIDKKLCEKIVNQKDLKFSPATTGGYDKVNPEYRRCYMKYLDNKFDKNIFNIIGKIIIKYKKEIPDFYTGLTITDTGYEHLLYMGSEKGEYKEHTDNSDTSPRVLSCSLILNDDYEGGNFAFFGGEYIVPKKAGSAVVFPSNFCFPHAVTPVTKGNRHAVITWIH